VKIGPEMNALDRHVGREDQFLPGADFHECGIVANPQAQTRNPPGGPALQPGNEFGFGSEARLVRHVVLEAGDPPTLSS
jgi:hypothetical protein